MNAQPGKKQNVSVSRGDLFEVGRHRILCGDSCSPEDVDRLFSEDKAALLLCDPPYGVSVVQSKRGFSNLKKSKDIANDDIDSDDEYEKFSRKWLAATLPHLSAKNSLYVFNSDKMIFALHDAMVGLGITFSQLVIWVKNNVVIGRKDFLPMHELIAVGWYGTHRFRRSKDKSVLFVPKPSKSPYHPTSKPVPLLRKLILNSSEIGEVVYDPFVGGGSTALAAEQTGRRCFAIELDPEYVATSIARLEKLCNVKAKRISK